LRIEAVQPFGPAVDTLPLAEFINFTPPLKERELYEDVKVRLAQMTACRGDAVVAVLNLQ
jgi:hypothetical protein